MSSLKALGGLLLSLNIFIILFENFKYVRSLYYRLNNSKYISDINHLQSKSVLIELKAQNNQCKCLV